MDVHYLALDKSNTGQYDLMDFITLSNQRDTVKHVEEANFIPVQTMIYPTLLAKF